MVDWPHAPLHRFGDSGIYFVTGATYMKQHFFRGSAALNELRDALFMLAKKHDCRLQSWSLFSNHYHLVTATDRGDRLHDMLERLHSETAVALNRAQGVRGRKVWFQFRESQITFQRSWLARMKYTNENAVHHRLVLNAQNYPWCSASWFAANARPAFAETVRRMKIDQISVYDDFSLECEGNAAAF
jgi:putative transposase